MRASLRRLGPLLAALVSLASAGAGAPLAATRAPTAVVVLPFDCPTPPLSLPSFVEALRVELAGVSIACCQASGAAGAPGSHPVHVAVAFDVCQPGAGRATVRIEDAAGARINRRDVSLEDVAHDARPRALALVVAELVRSAAPAAHSGPSTPPPVDTPQVPLPPGDVRPEVTFVLGADAILRLHPARDAALWGARLWLSGALGNWQLEGAVDGATGNHRYLPGTVDLRALMAGLTVSRRWGLGPLTAGAGLGADAGVTWIGGQAADPGVTTGSGAGLTGAVRARVLLEGPVGRTLRLRALIDGGLMLAPVDAYVDGARAAGTSGLFVIAGLGLCLNI